MAFLFKIHDGAVRFLGGTFVGMKCVWRFWCPYEVGLDLEKYPSTALKIYFCKSLIATLETRYNLFHYNNSSDRTQL